MTQEQNNLEQNIHYNTMGKPKLTLEPIANAIVNPVTQKEYDTLMQIYESADWKWLNYNPTGKNIWNRYKEKTYLTLSDTFLGHKTLQFGSLGLFDHINYDAALTIKEFFQTNNIPEQTITELNTWYDKNKPNRPSKG